MLCSSLVDRSVQEFAKAVKDFRKQRGAGNSKRKLTSTSLSLVTCFCLVLGLLSFSVGHEVLCWLYSSRGYAYMRRVTNRNYSHSWRDVIWRSILRDWPSRPVRLERWIIDRDLKLSLSRSSTVFLFELAPEPSKLFGWDNSQYLRGAKICFRLHSFLSAL